MEIWTNRQQLQQLPHSVREQSLAKHLQGRQRAEVVDFKYPRTLVGDRDVPMQNPHHRKDG